MIKVSVLYPTKEGSRFDFDYYFNTHMPMVAEKLAPTLRGVMADRGMSGPQPDSPPAYVAMAHLLFDSPEAFQTAFGPHAEAIMGDIPNYTDIEPIIQISEATILRLS